MHLGLSNDPVVEHRAELLSRYILKQVPNHLLDERERKERRVSQELEDSLHLAEEGLAKESNKVFSAELEEIEEQQEKVIASHHPSFAPQQTPKSGHFDDNVKPFFSSEKEAISEHKTSKANVAHKIQHAASKATHEHEVLPELEPSLLTLLTSETSPLRHTGISIEEGRHLYDKLAAGGMKCTADLITFLSEMKNRPSCNCGANRVFTSKKASSTHQEDCSTRQLNNWMPAMELLHIPLMTAMRLLKFLRPYLS